MANRIESYTVTIPSGTLESAPTTIDTTFDPGIVDRIDVMVPPGPSGLMGFRFAYGSEIIIPNDASKWLIFDNYQGTWELEDYPTGKHWAIVGYNTDIYDHSIYIKYHLSNTDTPASKAGPGAISAQPSPIIISSSG